MISSINFGTKLREIITLFLKDEKQNPNQNKIKCQEKCQK